GTGVGLPTGVASTVGMTADSWTVVADAVAVGEPGVGVGRGLSAGVSLQAGRHNAANPRASSRRTTVFAPVPAEPSLARASEAYKQIAVLLTPSPSPISERGATCHSDEGRI